MSDPISTPAPAPSAPTTTVAFSFGDAVKILETAGTAVAAINPASAGAVAAITGLIDLVDNVIYPAIKNHFTAHQITAQQQAQLASDSAALRAQVGAGPATIN